MADDAIERALARLEPAAQRHVDVEGEWVEAGEDDGLIHYSASQLEVFSRCNLKWWWKYIGGFTVPSSASQEYGVELHAQLESWINDGTTPADQRIASALYRLKEHGIVRGPDLLSEREMRRAIHIPEREMVGFVDLTFLGNQKRPRVWDLKTTSDLRRYAKTDYQLRENAQLCIYAYDTLHTVAPDAQAVEVAHLYVQSRGKIASEVVTVDLDRPSVEKRWGGLLRVIDEMEQVRQERDPARVPHNEMACNDYGGCPHRVRCNALVFGSPTIAPAPRSDEQAIGKFWEDDVTKLNPPDSTRRPEGAPPAIPETVNQRALPKVLQAAAKQEPKQPEGGQNKMSALSALAALGSGKPAAVEKKPEGPMGSLAAKLAGVAGTTPPNTAPVQPPPDFKKQEGPEEGTPEARRLTEEAARNAAAIRAQAAQEAAQRAQAQAAPSTRAALDALTAGQPATQEPTPKRGRGRPPGSRNRGAQPAAAQGAPKPEEARAVTVAQFAAPIAEVQPSGIGTSGEGYEVEQDAEESPELPAQDAAFGASQASGRPAEVAVAQTPTREESPSVGRLMFLFIDAIPICGFPQAPITLGAWLAPVLEQIRRDTGAPWDFHEFRKGPAVLNKYVAKAALPSALIMNSRSPEGAVLTEYLVGKAAVIIQGTR